MHRIDGAGATSDNRFTDGDPASATAATVVTDDWLNAVQEEIVSVISDPAVTPAIALDKTKTNQLVTAIKRIISASAIAYSQATETVLGVTKVATQVQVDEGVDDTTFVTPKKIRRGISYSLEPNGYFAFPSLMGGWIVQWGRGISAVSGPVTVPFQIAFPSKKFFEIAIPIVGSPIGWDVATSTGDASLTQAIFNRRAGNGSSTNASSNFDIYWMSIGK